MYKELFNGGWFYVQKTITILMAVLLCLSCTSTVFALNTEDAFVMLEADKIRRMDALYLARARLLSSSENHAAELARIDAELEALGVEEITYQEVAQKFGATVSPQETVVSTSTTDWTSLRTVVNYRGKFYELQVVTGQRKENNTQSPLYDNFIEVVHSPNCAQIAWNIFKAEVVDAVVDAGIDLISESNTKIGLALTGLKTAHDCIKEYDAQTNPYRVLDNVSVSYLGEITPMERYIFVKYKDTPDVGNQIVAYAGHAIGITVTTTIPGAYTEYINGVPHAKPAIDITFGEIYSPYYQTSYNKAADNFRIYKEEGLNSAQMDELIFNFVPSIDFHLALTENSNGEDIPVLTVTKRVPVEGTTFLGS